MSEADVEKVIMVTSGATANGHTWSEIAESALTDAGYQVQLSRDKSPSQLAQESSELKAVILDANFIDGEATDTRAFGTKVKSFKDELRKGQARDAALVVVGMHVGPSLIRDAFKAGAADVFGKGRRREEILTDFADTLPRGVRLLQQG